MTATSETSWESECLAYDPFAGDFNSSGDKILSDKIVTIRKQRQCCICSGNVKPKTRARVQKAIIDGDMMTCSMCHGCCKAMARSWTEDYEDDNPERYPGWSIERRSFLGQTRNGNFPANP